MCNILDLQENFKKEQKHDYNLVCEILPNFSEEFSFQSFCHCNNIISSRRFGFEINGLKTCGLVPFADMINHSRPMTAIWNYGKIYNLEERDYLIDSEGFNIEILDDVKKDTEIFASYGKKCNSKFLQYYGFLENDNDANEVNFKVNLDKNGPFFDSKAIFLKKDYNFENKITCCFGEDFSNERITNSFSVLRFLCIDNKEDLSLQNYYVTNNYANKEEFDIRSTPVLSINNEKSVLNKIKEYCADQLLKYKTSIDQDLKKLQECDLTFNQQNCIQFESGEKKVLNFLQDFVKNTEQLFYIKPSNIRMMLNHKPYKLYEDYVESVVFKINIFNN